ncbi:MAG: hypothetical protein ABI281_07525 [Caldimonas sp.]
MGRLFEILGLRMPNAPPVQGAKREFSEVSGSARAAGQVDAAHLMARHRKIKAELDAMLAKGGTLAATLRKQLDDFAKRVAARKFDDAAKILGRIEDLVRAVVGTDPKADVVADTSGAAPRSSEVSDRPAVASVRAEVEAMLAQATSLVLGAITADGPRMRVNTELGKLNGAAEKARKSGDSKAAIAVWNALKPAARALLAKAEAAAGASTWVDGQLAPLVDSASSAIATLAAAGPKGVLGGELAAVKADIDKFVRAEDIASLQSVVVPRLQKLHRLVTSLAPASARADAGLAQAGRVIEMCDPGHSVDIRASLKALLNQKSGAWPAGGSVLEIDAGVADFEIAIKRLVTDAELLKLQLDDLKDLDALTAKFDALKLRLDAAADPAAPKFIAKEQKAVATMAIAFAAAVVKKDVKAAQVALTAVAKALDELDKSRAAWDGFVEKLAAAKAGEIKTVLALKLLPPGLAATRDKAVKRGEADLVALAESGYPTSAAKKIAGWTAGAKAWAGAKEAYDLLHSDKPTAAGLAKLAKTRGGGPVLDALVADLPDDIPQEVLTEAVQARYGIVVKQYDHRNDKKTGATRTAANPKAPDKALKGLYRVLGKVPLKDTGKVTLIDRYTAEEGGAAYGGGEIDLYCGRPGDGKVQEMNKPGEVVPAGQAVDKNCEPVNPKVKAGYFDFATLHEVGHAVDDKKNIMAGGRNKDAGWLDHSAADIAAIAAPHLKYDAAYIQAMMESKANKPPVKKPPLPAGRNAAEWDLQRRIAEDWVTGVRTTAGLWWHAADCKVRSIGDRVYQEAYAGEWVSYKLAARAQGVTGYQFRSSAEWFAELYAAYFMKKMNPKHPAAAWLGKLKAEAS